MILDEINQEFDQFRRKRIISLVPSITETLFDLGMEDSVIGVSRYCIYPTKAKEKELIGGTKSPKINEIKALKPDIIFVNQEENKKKHFEKLSKIAPTFVTYPKTVSDGIMLIEKIGKLLNVEIDLIQSFDKKLDEITKLIEAQNYREKTVFCPIWKNPWMTINSDTYINSVLNYFNLDNIFSEVETRYPIIELNQIKRKVDLVLLPNEPYEFEERDGVELVQHKFMKNSLIELVDGSYLSWYGTRTIKALNYFYELFNQLESG